MLVDQMVILREYYKHRTSGKHHLLLEKVAPNFLCPLFRGGGHLDFSLVCQSVRNNFMTNLEEWGYVCSVATSDLASVIKSINMLTITLDFITF